MAKDPIETGGKPPKEKPQRPTGPAPTPPGGSHKRSDFVWGMRPICMDTGLYGVGGECPRHHGDACLIVPTLIIERVNELELHSAVLSKLIALLEFHRKIEPLYAVQYDHSVFNDKDLLTLLDKAKEIL